MGNLAAMSGQNSGCTDSILIYEIGPILTQTAGLGISNNGAAILNSMLMSDYMTA